MKQAPKKTALVKSAQKKINRSKINRSKTNHSKTNRPNTIHAKAIAALKKCDPRLALVIEKAPEFDLIPDKKTTPFAALARSIVYQQLSGKAAASILKKFILSYGSSKFPTPQSVLETSHEKLRDCGLSGSKAYALKDLAAKVVDGTIPTTRKLNRMDDEEIIECLTVVKGIGRWTVEMFLIFKMGRLDIISAGDYGVRKGFAKTYGKRKLPHPKVLLKHSIKWKPYRSLATWYLWRSLET
jgi:DNA-3-methyladenine glycosylase II